MLQAKRILRPVAALLLTVILSFSCLTAFAAGSPAKVFIRGQELTASPAVCQFSGVIYAPLRAFVTALDEEAQISWNERRRTAYIQTAGMEIAVPDGKPYVVANGRYLYLYDEVRNENGSLMVPIEAFARALGVGYDWDENEGVITITGEVKQLLSGYYYYDEENLYWLSRIVYSEAGGETLEGQIAVAEVVLNRMNNDYWPDDVYGVVFDDRFGVQFSPTANGTIYQDPSAEAVIAAKLAMDGANVVEDSFFFVNPSIASSRWFDESLTFVTTIGSHSFYTTDM